MTSGSPGRLIILFAIPLMLGNICQQLYTMVDTMVVGQIAGVEALAALGAVDRKSTACTDLCFLCGFHRHRVHITHFFLKHTAGAGGIRTFQRITAHKLRKALVLMGRRILFRLHLAQPYMKASVCKRPRRLNSGKTCAYYGNSLFIQVYPILISFRSSYPHRQDAHIRSRPWRSIPDPACRPS